MFLYLELLKDSTSSLVSESFDLLILKMGEIISNSWIAVKKCDVIERVWILESDGGRF